MEGRQLTDRQLRFVEEYLVDLNAGAAAARAGYAAKSACTVGPRIKRIPHVRAAIDAAMVARSQRLSLTQDRVVAELARIAFADIRDFASWDDAGVRLLPSAQLSADQTACVAEIVEHAAKTGKGLRIKLHGKTQALAVLARHLSNASLPEEAGMARPLTIITWVPEPASSPEETSETIAQGAVSSWPAARTAELEEIWGPTVAATIGSINANDE